MQSSRAGVDDIRAYEGLVGKTAEMFGPMVGLEPDDMRQELRIKVVKARRSYDPARSKMTERAYVFSCVTNFVKDLKRDAARRSAMRVGYIEDHRSHPDKTAMNREGSLAAFEIRYLSLSREEVFAAIEEEGFVLPSTVTEDERRVLLLLISGYAQTEIASLLELTRWQVMDRVRSLRQKLADWRPSAMPEAPLVALPELAAA